MSTILNAEIVACLYGGLPITTELAARYKEENFDPVNPGTEGTELDQLIAIYWRYVADNNHSQEAYAIAVKSLEVTAAVMPIELDFLKKYFDFHYKYRNNLLDSLEDKVAYMEELLAANSIMARLNIQLMDKLLIHYLMEPAAYIDKIKPLTDQLKAVGSKGV